MGQVISFGDAAARLLSQRVTSVADATALAAIPADYRAEGDTHVIESDGTAWRFSAASTASDSTGNLVITPASGSGRWLRQDRNVHLRLAIGHATADAAALFTVPTGFVLNVSRAWWEVVDGFTGGSSSAIGVSSSNASYNTKGDILGGAAGNVAATLVTGKAIGGTVGAKFGSNGMIVLVATNTIRFDRITSAFTAGSGFVNVLVDVLNA